MPWRERFPTRWASALLLAALLLPAVSASGRGHGADGRFEKRESSHFVLFQDVDIDESGGLRGSRRFEQQVLAELESAYDRLDDLLGLRPRRKLDVFVYDAAIFDARFTGRFRFQAAGFFNVTKPREYGGYERPYHDFCEIIMEIAKGCPVLEAGHVVQISQAIDM